MNLKLFFIFLFLCSFWVNSYAQNSIEFGQLRGENVPTQSITYAIDTDSIGNIWVASEEGVLKHNSKYFVIYNSYNGLPEILSNRIKEVFVDSKQRIWIGSEEGVSVYNEKLDVFDYVETAESLNPSLIEVIVEDVNQVIWAGGFNGLWKYDETIKKFKRAVPNKNIQALYALEDKLMFGTQKGLFYYNDSTDSLLEIELDSKEKNIRYITDFDGRALIGTKTGKLYSIEDGEKFARTINLNFDLSKAITDIVETFDGNYLIATDGDGIYKLTSTFQKIDHYIENPNELFSISSNGVYDIEYDREHILWIATYGGGLNYFNSNELPFQNVRHLINDENSIVANFTRSISQDENDNIWFGTKKGISVWNKSDDSWRHLKNFSSVTNDEDIIVLALESDGDYMWVGTYNAGLYKIHIDTFNVLHYNSKVSDEIIEKVYAIHKDTNGNIWAGGIEKDLIVISPTNEISTYPIQQIKSFTETSNGIILASGRQGIYRINHEKGTFGLVEKLLPNKKTLAFSTINSVVETEDENLILATNGEGLVFYDTEKEIVKKLKMTSGMPSDIVQGIIIEQRNNLWASTTKGLINVKMTQSDTIINVYDQKDGLASTEYNYGSFKSLGEGLMAFGGVDGVTIFNPKLVKNESYKPKLVIDAFKISNEKIEPGQAPLKGHINTVDKVNLRHTQNSVEIQFTGILHSSSSKVKYSWMLKGFDKTWSKPTSNNFATYTNLSPNDYVFKVKASNKYGNFSGVKQFRIVVNPPWWATNKAYVLYALALIALVYGIIHVTSVIVKKRNADEQIDFFNNVTHEIKTPLTILISSLDNVTENMDSKEDSAYRIKATVKRINSLFEQMLNFQKVTSADGQGLDISKMDVYAHIKQRIKNFEPLTRERNINIVLNNNWNESLHFDKDSFDKIILNLISNAIKYSFDNGNITINTLKTSIGDLKIEVIDEGLGIPKDQQKHILKRYFRGRNAINSQSAGTGLGLMMVKKILEKTDGSISFVSTENKGTTFTVLIKNLKKEYERQQSQLGNTEQLNQPNDSLQDYSELNEFSDNKILIVEDNDELRRVLANTLGNYFQVYEAANGKDGIEKASTIFPDIILTDLIMPEMDGMQMAKELKKDISLNHIPIFMLTVLQNSQQKLESIETGISEYFEKPIDIKLLLAKIANRLKWHQKLRKKYVHDSDADNAELFRNKNDQEFLTNLENRIIENIENNNFSVHDLSASFGMSRTSLYMKLKSLVDLSPQDFVIHTKLKHAKALLIRGEFSIKEVAYQSGFSNPKYFSTSFKKFYGVSPSGFLESLKK